MQPAPTTESTPLVPRTSPPAEPPEPVRELPLRDRLVTTVFLLAIAFFGFVLVADLLANLWR